MNEKKIDRFKEKLKRKWVKSQIGGFSVVIMRYECMSAGEKWLSL